MKTALYRTVSASTAIELDSGVNALLDQGYQLYGSPYLSDRVAEGLAGNTAFYQAMTMDQETRNINDAARLKELAQSKEIKELKMV